MAQPKRLTMGVDSPPTPTHVEEVRVAVLRATIEHYIPEFARAVASARQGNADVLMLHQDAFAAGYHDDEYMLLGMALKYAGLSGVTVTIAGKNQSTMKEKEP